MTATLTLNDLADPAPEQPLATTDLQRDWLRDGYVILPGLIPEAPIARYTAKFQSDALRRAYDAQTTEDLQLSTGYGIGTPYLRVPELRDVAMHRNLTPVLTELFNEPLALHLNLTGWRSTRRAWHQDAYLNPPCVGHAYAATWIALDDASPDAGPFQFVPGSHRWPSITKTKMLAAMNENGSDPDWPWRSERILGPLFDREIEEREATVTSFLAERGDVLIWHANLVHRGSTPVNPELERRALISHWSVVSSRCDMPPPKRYVSAHADGLWFPLGPFE